MERRLPAGLSLLLLPHLPPQAGSAVIGLAVEADFAGGPGLGGGPADGGGDVLLFARSAVVEAAGTFICSFPFVI